MLLAFLDLHRTTLRRKCAGLTQAQLAAQHPPSTLSLAGLVKHLALVEDWWLGVCLVGTPDMEPFDEVDGEADPDWEFRTARDDEPAYLWELYDRAVVRSDANLAAVESLDDLLHRRHSRTGEGLGVRWVLLHMIEEYARHNGHADLIREAIDGTTGE